MKKNKRLTFLLLHLNYGGIERQVTRLANNLSEDYIVEILVLYNILGTSFYKLNDNIKVKYILPYGPNKNEIKDSIKKFRFLNLLKELYKAIKILYTKYIKFGKIVNMIDTDILISSRIEFSKQIKRKDILTISQEHSYINSKSYTKKVRKSFKYINYLVVMTNKAKSDYDLWLQNVKNKPEVIVIPNIIEENLNNSKLNSNQIISVGRLEKIKDFETLIDVFKIVNNKNPHWNLKIIGEGSEKENLIKKVNALKLEKNVIFTGKLNDEAIKKEFLNSSIYVLTSKSESFSLSLCEAMSYGIPSISFNVDVGPREIIKDMEDGFLIKSKDIIEMAEKICMLIENEQLRTKIGNNASKNITRFYSQSILKKWIKLLN